MGKKLKAYILSIQLLLESGEPIGNIAALKQELLIEIGFWQHERLIHLLVTILFALVTVIVFLSFVLFQNLPILLLLGALLVLLIPYIRHYYILENGVQTLYVFYEELTRREHTEGFPSSCIPQRKGVVIKPIKSPPSSGDPSP